MDLMLNWRYIVTGDKPNSWEDEPKNCLFEVIGTDKGSENRKIYLECVKSCGLHQNTEISESEYDSLSEDIRGDLLELVNMSDIMLEFDVANKQDEPRFFNMQEEISRFYDKLQIGKW